MSISLQDVSVERWPVAGAFTISRGAKTHVDVVRCVLAADGARGQGEGTPIYYHGETAEDCAAAIRAHCVQGRPLTRDAVNALMPPGAARNALDCALWDLEAKRSGEPVWRLAGLPEPRPLATAFTISLDMPDAMEAAARKAAGRFSLLKCKLTGAGDVARIEAVRRGAPEARLIVDANEGWAALDVAAEAAAMAALGVELVEQPLPAARDADLVDISAPIPFCADESCQSRAELPRLGGYQAVNIKLDKAGGLTEALALAAAARAAGKRLMVGCMLSTSLGIAPAFLVAQQAEWVDLDGALLLAKDRDGGLPLVDGLLQAGTIWG